MTPQDSLSPRLIVSPAELVEALDELETLTAVGEYFGVDRRTVARWTEKPAFRQYLASLRAAVERKLAAAYETDLALALEVNRTIARDDEQTPFARLQAAQALVGLHRQAPRDVEATDDVAEPVDVREQVRLASVEALRSREAQSAARLAGAAVEGGAKA